MEFLLRVLIIIGGCTGGALVLFLAVFLFLHFIHTEIAGYIGTVLYIGICGAGWGILLGGIAALVFQAPFLEYVYTGVLWGAGIGVGITIYSLIKYGP